jgi:hypothetical protein
MKGTRSWILVIALAVALMPMIAAAAGTDSEGAPSFLDRFKLPFPHDSEYSNTILNWQYSVTEKPLYMLKAAQKGVIASPGFLISGSFWASTMHEESNKSGKFPILSRLPDQHGRIGTSGSKNVINSAALGLTGRFFDWVTLYAQPEYTEIEFIGQNKWQLRKVFAMVGNLDKSPLYAYFGRNTVDFGWMDGYNPFTHTVTNHFWRVDSDDPVFAVGYYKNGFHLTGTLIPSGRHLRVADSEDESGWENGAISASYDLPIGEKGSVKFGAGYIHSTIYNRDIAHHPGSGFPAAVTGSIEYVRNPAYDLFVSLRYDSFRAGIEYTTTTKDWPATKFPVRSVSAMAAYDAKLFEVPITLSAVYGLGRQGPSGKQYEKLTQLAFGLEAYVLKNLSLAFEYVRNEAFVPLILITLVSDKDVETDTFIFGAKFWF